MNVCALCGPRSSRAKMRTMDDGSPLCGRCHFTTVVKPSRRDRNNALHRAWRARVGGKRLLWVAFGRGDVLGVYSTEAAALRVSSVVRSYRINQIPSERRREKRMNG